MHHKQAYGTTREDLASLVSEVLGNLAFMVSDDEPLHLSPGAVWLRAEIRYDGTAGGTLTCWATRDFAIQLAANLLGIGPDEGDAQANAEDALREFINVLCGQLVTAWYGSQTVIDLSIPTVHADTGPPPAPPADGDASCQLSISGEPFYCAHRRSTGGQIQGDRR